MLVTGAVTVRLLTCHKGVVRLGKPPRSKVSVALLRTMFCSGVVALPQRAANLEGPAVHRHAITVAAASSTTLPFTHTEPPGVLTPMFRVPLGRRWVPTVWLHLEDVVHGQLGSPSTFTVPVAVAASTLW